MGRWVRSCLQSMLKMVNSVIGLLGMGMIMYSMWMFRSWYKQFDGFPSSFDSSPPWFIYIFFGLGIFHCLITCAGLIAAETVNIHCLSCYMSFVFLLIVSESAITADIYLNKNWEEVCISLNDSFVGFSFLFCALHISCFILSLHQDFPEDPTGKFDELKKFVRSNQEMCKWIGLLIVAAQALSIILAMVLKVLGPNIETDYDSDDDYIPARLPLLRNQSQPNLTLKNYSWNVKL
ncbi:tetraspanin-19-like isoform X1 [Zingiber officinale]|uniref:tetraspanin-19-like isoform X1 n=1 Tax=Zingiber officinale TaxID=94328 RepID=UPI001C4D4583|nr:tetraspanin-19-like isoform X1 [Zingiber officinale]